MRVLGPAQKLAEINRDDYEETCKGVRRLRDMCGTGSRLSFDTKCRMTRALLAFSSSFKKFHSQRQALCFGSFTVPDSEAATSRPSWIFVIRRDTYVFWQILRATMDLWRGELPIYRSMTRDLRYIYDVCVFQCEQPKIDAFDLLFAKDPSIGNGQQFGHRMRAVLYGLFLDLNEDLHRLMRGEPAKGPGFAKSK